MSEQTLSQLYKLLGLEPDAQAEIVLKPLAEQLPEGGVGLAAAWLLRHGGAASAPVLLHTLDQSGDRLQALFWLFLKTLSARQQALFYASAAFAPGRSFSKEALLAVWGGEIFNESMRQGIEQDLEALVPALLSLEGERYTLPAALRPYAEQILAQSGDQTAARRLHFEYYTTKVHRWGYHIDLYYQIAHALKWACEYAPAQAVEFAGYFLETTKFNPTLQAEVEEWLGFVSEASQRVEEITPELLKSLQKLGECAVYLGDGVLGRNFYERALSYPEMSLRQRAQLYEGLAQVSSREEAITLYHRALMLYKQADDLEGRAKVLRALEQYAEVLEVLHQMNDDLQTRWKKIDALRALGETTDNPIQAGTYYRQALDLCPDDSSGSEKLLLRVLCLIVEPDDEQAEGQFEALLEEDSSPTIITMVDWARGERALRLGRFGVAAAHFRRVLSQQSKDTLFNTESLFIAIQVYASLAKVRMQQGQHREAVELLQDGLSVTRHIPDAVKRYMVAMVREGGEAMIAAWEETGRPFPIWLKM